MMQSNYQARESLNQQYAQIKGASSINDVAVGFGKGWVVFAVLSAMASAFSFYQDFNKSLGVIATLLIVIVLAVALEAFKHLSIKGMFSSMNFFSKSLISLVAIGLIMISFYTHYKSIQTFQKNLVTDDLREEIKYQRDLQNVQNSQINSILATNAELAKALNNGVGNDDVFSSSSVKSNNNLIATLQTLSAKNNMTNTNILLRESREAAKTTASAILVIFIMVEFMALFSILSKIIVVDNISENVKGFFNVMERLEELESNTYKALGYQKMEQTEAKMGAVQKAQNHQHEEELKRIGNISKNISKESETKEKSEPTILIAPKPKEEEQPREEVKEDKIPFEPKMVEALDFSTYNHQEQELIRILWNNGQIKKGEYLIPRSLVIADAKEFMIPRAGSILTNLMDNLMSQGMIERPDLSKGYIAKVPIKRDLWTEDAA